MSVPLDHAVLVGAGNIGSHAAEQLARLPGLNLLTIIDFDHYEFHNLTSQQIEPRDVGRPKALVLAERVSRVRPGLAVRPIVARVERVPLGRLRGVLLAAVDSRRARMHVNEAAWRLNAPWIDTGVEAVNSLVRVNVYRPADAAPCLECAWDEIDYAAVEQVVPCEGNSVITSRTNAPASLGAIAAGLMVLEYRKILANEWKDVLAGRQAFLDLQHHRQYVTRFDRNRKCRFDHEVWEIAALPGPVDTLTLADCFGNSGLAIRSQRAAFTRALRCLACGERRAVLHLQETTWPEPCECGGRLISSQFESEDWLARSGLSYLDLARPLSALGLKPGDVISVQHPSGITRFELPFNMQSEPEASVGVLSNQAT